MYTREKTREQLQGLAEEGYRSFQSGLLPGKEGILGVRLPELRKMAKEICRGDWRAFLRQNREALDDATAYYEEALLWGLVIGEARDASRKEFLAYVEAFVPYIDNWAVCDSFCASLKKTRQYKEEVWELLQSYLKSDKEFEARFAVVMLLNYYLESERLETLFAAFDRIEAEGYYAKMAVAWAISLCYIRFPKETEDYLRENERLEAFTLNKAIQKICESRQVDSESKKKVRGWKRKASKWEGQRE